jgi:hypothetical protein
MQMSPNWVGPNMPMKYNMSEDQGLTFNTVTRKVMFGAYFFVGEERRIISRTAFSVADLFAKVGGVFSILKLVLGIFAQLINMDAIISYLVEDLYFSKEGEGKFNRIEMTTYEWLTWNFNKWKCMNKN